MSIGTLSPTTLSWLEMREIDFELAVRLGWHSVEQDDGEWLRQPFLVGGEVVNHRLRSVDGVGCEMEEPGPLPLWNIDVMSDASLTTEPWIWVETVEDAAVAIMCGFLRTVALPLGSIGGPMQGVRDAQSKFGFLQSHEKTIAAFRKMNRERVDTGKDPVPIVLAMDNDNGGTVMLHELANRLGTALCKWVRYPKANPKKPPFPNGRTHCKDLTEVHMHWGPTGVRRTLVDNARWMKIKGVARMSEIPPRPERNVWLTGLDWLDMNLKIRFGDLWVVTGVPGHGKTTMINAVINSAVRRYGWGCVWASFEQDPQSDHKRALRSWYLEKEECYWTPQDETNADAWIDDHFVFIVPSELEDEEGDWDEDIPLPNAKDDEGQRADVRWIIKSISQAVYRYGVKIAVVDPWNEIDHIKPPDITETAYIGWALKQFRKAAMKLNILMVIIAHPTKMQAGEIPGMYSISDCYSSDTEVLTKRGWLLHEDMNLDDEVMCFDLSTEDMRWEKPSRIVQHDHDGNMVNFKGYGFDLLVSPNHRMVVKPAWEEPVGSQSSTGIGRPVKWPKDQWSFAYAEEITSGARFKMPKAGNPIPGAALERIDINGRSFPAHELMELAGWWVAEGSWVSVGISLCQAVGEKADEIDRLIAACGLKPTRAEALDPRGFRTMVTWYFGVTENREFASWLRAEGGRVSANRTIPTVVFTLSVDLKASFLRGYIAGDGNRQTDGDSFRCTTTSKPLYDGLMRLAVESGIPVCGHVRKKVRDHHTESYHIDFGRPERREITLRGGRNISTVPYTGKIWCLTVPTGAYVTRRNGNVVVSGNSANWANKPDIGLVVYQHEESSKSLFRICKVRQRGIIGQKGDVWCQYDPATRHFSPTGDPMALEAEQEAEYRPKPRRRNGGGAEGGGKQYRDD